MKRLLCLLLALAVLLPGSAAVADPEEWEYQTNGDYTIRYPSYIQIYSVLEEDYGWNMDVLEDPEGTDSTGSTVGIIILFAGADDWTGWMETGAFPDERGSAETMRRVAVDEIPVNIDAGMDMSYALFLSEDGERMVEAFIFDPEEGDTDYVVTCRYPAYDDGEYSDVFHWMIETLTFANASGSGSSGVTVYSDETGIPTPEVLSPFQTSGTTTELTRWSRMWSWIRQLKTCTGSTRNPM